MPDPARNIPSQLDEQERARAEAMAQLQDREAVGRQFHQQYALLTHQTNAQGEMEHHCYTEPSVTHSLADSTGRRLQVEAEQRGESPLHYFVVPTEAMPV